MNNIQAKFDYWFQNEYFDQETRDELESIRNNSKEIEERFYKELDFGTGGLRGIIGAGTNRMNKYTIRKSTQGLANFILNQGEEAKTRGVVIAYDSRYKSSEFALETAMVLAGNNIKAYLFDELRPVPELSFAVRHLNAVAGVVVTASHNPKQYNGYKVYGEDGAQLSIDDSNKVIKEVNSIEDITKIKLLEKEQAIQKGLIEIIGKEIDDVYIEKLKSLRINTDIMEKEGRNLKIVYTPLHGTGNKPVRRVLAECGFENVIIVKEQEHPDHEFSTVKQPNPEDKNAFDLAIKIAKEENADLIIGTDPDCDRLGVLVRNESGEFNVLTGNQTGCLMVEYILSQKQKRNELPSNGFVVKTIVTTDLARKIADNYDIEIMDVLTGFKFIGEKIKVLDELGNRKFLFGFEESYGYLAGTFSRDKDAVLASMLVAEISAYYKSRNMNLYDGLIEIYEKYGYTLEDITSFTLEGKDGLEKISNTMNTLRENRYSRFNDLEVETIEDYLKSEKFNVSTQKLEQIELPKSDVLKYKMVDGSWFCVRPSGTEPKIKIYYGVSDSTLTLTEEKLRVLKENALSVIEKLLK